MLGLRRDLAYGLLCGCALLVALLFSGSAIVAQITAPSSDEFEYRINQVARSLQSNPRLKKLSQAQREGVVNFITGNMGFVMLHELGHAAVAEFQLPVIGREEDGADDFAIVQLLRAGSAFSHRVLVEAAKGWFLSDLRDRNDKEPLYFFDEHGLDKQRAYSIVCIMVGSDPTGFKDLADETKLPDDRQRTCKRDYDKAVSGWDAVLKSYRRGADQPKTKIDVVYGDGQGKYDAYAEAFRSLRLLDVVAERAADLLAWPLPFTLETKTCGFINGQWIGPEHRLVLCYELAADFAELYRDYNDKLMKTKRKAKSKR